MARKIGTWLCLLAMFGPAHAGDPTPSLPYHKHKCPHSMYNFLGYWAPRVWRVDAYCHPRPNIYPVNTTPGLYPEFRTFPFPCPAVDPAARPYYPNIGPPDYQGPAVNPASDLPKVDKVQP
jgi:hypothetical protein